MKWDKFKCDLCGRKYAFEQPEGEEVEEPMCPVCGDEFFEHLAEVKEPEPYAGLQRTGN